jgi:ubiquinone/menaquinone biosynthesis C-methylase UbiE
VDISTLTNLGTMNHRLFDTLDTSIIWPLAIQALPTPCDHILEVGCGKSALADKLGHYARHVTALDNDINAVEYQLRRADRQPHVRYLRADLSALGEFVAPSSINAVLSVFVLHETDLTVTLDAIANVVALHGRLIIIDIHSEGRTNPFLFIADQILFSYVRYLHGTLSLARMVGFSSLLRFCLQRARCLLTADGRRHVTCEMSQGRPPSIAHWDHAIRTTGLRVIHRETFGPLLLLVSERHIPGHRCSQ